MLKTIEEPPDNVFIFLLCEDIDGIIDTVKSRCCIHKLRPLKDREVELYLNKRFPDIPKDRVALAVAFGKGVPGKAEDLIENTDFYNIRKNVFEIMESTRSADKTVPIKYEKFFNEYGSSRDDILDMFITIIRDIIIYKEAGDESLLINIDKTREIKDLANIFSLTRLSDMIKVIEENRSMLKSNVSSSLAFISMVLRMQEV
jgi:DNA polymerase III, gamma/tau subunits